MIFGKHRLTIPVQPGTQSVGILRDTDPFPGPAPGLHERFTHRPDGMPSGSPVRDLLPASDRAVLCTRCAVVVTRPDQGEGSAVTALHPALFDPEAMTDTFFDIVRSASDEHLSVYAALVPSPCPSHVRSGLSLPFSEDDACACASELLWPSLSASPFKRPPAEGRLISADGGGEVPWPRGLVLGGSLPGEPFSLPKGGFCWRPLGWSP